MLRELWWIVIVTPGTPARWELLRRTGYLQRLLASSDVEEAPGHVVAMALSRPSLQMLF